MTSDGTKVTVPGTVAPERGSAWRVAGLGVVLLVAALLRGVGLAEQGLLYAAEERYLVHGAATFATLRTTLGLETPLPFALPDALDDRTRPLPGEPVWSAVIALVMAVVGVPAAWTARLAAAFFGVATVGAAWWAGRRWFGDWAGAFAFAVVCALMPSFVWWGRLGTPAAGTLLLLVSGVAALLSGMCATGARRYLVLSGVLFGMGAGFVPQSRPAVCVVALWLAWSALRPADGGARRWSPLLPWSAAALPLVGLGLMLNRGLSGPALTGGLPALHETAYWVFRREGVVMCGLVALGLGGLRGLPARRGVLLIALVVIPWGWQAVRGGDGAGVSPLFGVYLGLALAAAGGVRMLVRVRPAGVALALGVAAFGTVLAASWPLTRTHAGTRELAAWLRREAPARLGAQGQQPAVVLLGQQALPPVRFATGTAWPQTWWDDPPHAALDLMRLHGGYLLVVAEEGYLGWDWEQVLPVRRFPRVLPRPALYMSDAPGATAAKRLRLARGAYLKLAVYDASAVAARAERHDEPHEHPVSAAFARAGRFGALPSSVETPAWQTAFRADLRETLGLTLMTAPDAPSVRVTERVAGAGYVRERVVLETEPGFYVPAYVLRPTGVAAPPVAVVLHGHGPGKRMVVGLAADAREARLIAREHRDLGVQLVRRGYAVIAPDLRGLGELMRPEDVARGESRSCVRLQLEAQLVGRSLIGERVFDVMRWLDYAAARPDLDARRPILVGHSAGGTAALFTAALDERVATTFVSGYFGSFRDTLGALDLCACNYAPRLALLGDIGDVAALIAPRRVRLSLGRLDGAFPLRSAEAALWRVQPWFAAVGGTMDLRVGDLGHIVYPEHLWELLGESGMPVPAPTATKTAVQ